MRRDILQIEHRVPSAHNGGTGIKKHDLVKAVVLARRVVYDETEKLFLALQCGDIDTTPLVLPRKPVRQRQPVIPFRDPAIRVQLPANFVITLVLPAVNTGLYHIIDHEYDEILGSVAVEIGDCYAAALVLEWEPIGHFKPVGPAGGHVAVRIQGPANTVKTPVLP